VLKMCQYTVPELIFVPEFRTGTFFAKNTYQYGMFLRSRGSSVSIVSDDGAIGVRSPAEAKDFSSSRCVQTGSGAHPASCTMGTGGPFPGAKRGRCVTLTTPLSIPDVKNE
jgi:hypothetical protein